MSTSTHAVASVMGSAPSSQGHEQRRTDDELGGQLPPPVDKRKRKSKQPIRKQPRAASHRSREERARASGHEQRDPPRDTERHVHEQKPMACFRGEPTASDTMAAACLRALILAVKLEWRKRARTAEEEPRQAG